MNRRMRLLSLLVVSALALLYVALPFVAGAASGGSSVYGTSSKGYPEPIGSTANRLNVDSRGTTVLLASADGGPIALIGGRLPVDSTGTTVLLSAPDGGVMGTAAAPIRVDPTGTTTQPGAEVPFNGSDSCITTTLPASGLPDGGTYSLNVAADTWHVLEVKGDGSGGWMGCWAYSRLSSPQDCTAFPGLKDGQQTFESFTRVTTADAGVLNGRALIYAYATVAGTVVKLCPKTASR